MFAFIARRFASMLLVLLCVVTATFFLVACAPGDPFSSERNVSPTIRLQQERHFDMDGPLWRQYLVYLGVWRNSAGHYSGLIQGDLKIPIKYRDYTVNEIVAQSFPVSAMLGVIAFCIAMTVGVWLGCLAAARKDTAIDFASMAAALALISIPNFVVGPVLILIFALWVHWLPVGGWGSVSSVILPAITLAGPYIAYVARLMRTSMLDVLQQDYLRTARAKGLRERRTIYLHALKGAILPAISFAGPLAANLVTGSIVVESIFKVPGMGGFFVNSILNRDRYLICGVVIVYCAVLVVMNLIVDIVYSLLNPRIRLYD